MIKELNVHVPGKQIGLTEKVNVVREDVFAFIESDARNCEIAIFNTAHSTQAAYFGFLNRHGLLPIVSCIMREGRVFLIRKEIV